MPRDEYVEVIEYFLTECESSHALSICESCGKVAPLSRHHCESCEELVSHKRCRNCGHLMTKAHLRCPKCRKQMINW